GSLTFALARRCPGATIVGIDALPSSVDFARRNNPYPRRVSFEAGDACNLAYDDGQFDHTISALAINFIPDAAAAVREMTRVTKPGAIVAATLWDLLGGLTYHRMMLDTAAAIDRGAAQWRDAFLSTPGTRPGALAGLWREAGLKNVKQ